MPRPDLHRVVVLVLPGVVAFDLSIPAQVFGHRDERDRYSFALCAQSAGQVPSTTGFDIAVEHDLDILAEADTVVVPGFFPHDSPAVPVLTALRGAAARGARMVSVCTGAFALAAAGLLDGRRVTTHWRDAGELAARYPSVIVDPDVLFVDEGLMLTSAGVAAGIDLCLHLVRTDHGADAAARIARRMVVAPFRDGGQAQFIERPVPVDGRGLSTTCAFALAHLAEPLTVLDLARHAGYSTRTFARHFLAETGLSPLRWLAAQRVLTARRLLESTDLSVEQIAEQSGLGSAANLRVNLARDAATTPTGYRKAYRGLHASSHHTGRH